jgi:hypothetical protein
MFAKTQIITFKLSRMKKSLTIILGLMSAALAFAQTPGLVTTESPKIFEEGKFSTGDSESCPHFAPDGKSFYFMKSSSDQKKWVLYSSEYKKGAWSTPTPLPFSGKYRDADPFITKDGKTMYFISNRPVSKDDSLKKDTDIWKVEKIKGSWGEPIHLGNVINSNVAEYFPTLTDDGVLYFGSRRPGGSGGCDIYRSVPRNGTFTEIENLGYPLNSQQHELEPFIAGDESYIIFMGLKGESFSTADFYVSYRVDGKWTNPEALPSPVNSEFTEWAPAVTRDGKFFMWASQRKIISDRPLPSGIGNGLNDLYYINFDKVKGRAKNQ